MSLPKCVLIFLIFLLSYFEQEYAYGRTYTIMGSVECNGWNKDRTNQKYKDEKLSALIDTQWILGYLSGINSISNNKDVLNDVDVETIQDWIDKYCQENPDKDVANGALELYLKLAK